ncbi:MAG: cytochrome c3 family protein [Bryobacterales bacterium]|nr:cytochrome c3 family protein [Bryobacterales bacterium]
MRSAIPVALLFAAFHGMGRPQSPAVKPDTCLDCHSALEDRLGRPAQLIQADIHKRNGFSCADCHGGDPTSMDMEVSMDPRRGFVGKIDRRKIPELCARCHSDATLIHKFRPQQRVDQLALYRTSVHGKRLAGGDVRVATCIDCHSVHDIREVKDGLSPVHPLKLPATCARCHANAEHMKGYDIATSQFEQYQRSVHWEALAKRGDLSAPSCATCHGSHGAAPPGVASVERVCGTCHVVFQNLFDQSPHRPAFEAMGLAACVVCHSNHEVLRPSPEMLGVDSAAVCLRCHAKDDPGYAVAATMRQEVDRLRSALTVAEAVLKQAETSGMEVSEGKLQLVAAHEEWIKARVEVHAFRLDAVKSPVSRGLEMAQKGRQVGLDALRERNVRRLGLAASLVAMAITLAGLWMAVRYIEQRKRTESPLR